LLLYVKLSKIVQKEKLSNLQMVARSIALIFNLLTGFNSSLVFGLVTSFFENWNVSILGVIFIFLEDSGVSRLGYPASWGKK